MTAALDPTGTTPTGTTPTTATTPSAQLTRVLTDSVRRATGMATAEPRPGQLLAAQDIYAAMTSEVPGHVSANCPTGVGKSLAVLSTSMLRAAVAGERTVIATESLGLQGQYLDKDAPPVAAAVAAETGRHVRVALLKGWSNYACFGGDVEVLTQDGPKPIRDLSGTSLNLLDSNREWTKSAVRSFGSQQIWRLVLQRGFMTKEIATTAEHRWFVDTNANRSSQATERVTSALKPGDSLRYNAPKNRVLGKMIPSTFGIAQGLVFGDGTRFRSTDGGDHPGACTIMLHGRKNWPLARFFNGAPQTMEEVPRDGYAECVLRVSGLPSFFKDKPSLTANTGFLYGWLAGYFAADGTVSKNGYLSISSARREHLEFVAAVCTSLGIDCGSITHALRVGKSKNGVATSLYGMTISPSSIGEEFLLIDEHRRRWLASNLAAYKRRRTSRRWKVVRVEPTDKTEEVYCAIVPTTASFTLADNILTGNCAENALTTAAAVLGKELSALTKLGPAKVADLLDAKAKPTGLGSAGATTLIDRQPLSTVELARAAAWALRQSLGAGTGDKDKYPHAVGYEIWAAVSTTPAECLGADACPLIDICRPTAARTAAAEADILVTNHAMLGVQAAVNAPIVVGSKRLGHIDHIIVDEAHALPGIVRSQGAKELSGRRIRSVVSTLGGCLTESDPPVARMLANGLTIADAVDAELARFVREAKTSEPVATITEVGDPLEDTGPMLSGWLDDARTMLKQMLDRSSGGPASLRRSRRATDRLSGLTTDLVAIRVHRDGIARWVDRGETRPGQRPQSPAGKASPVDVAPMLIGALWTAVDNRSSDDDPLDQPSFRPAGEDGPGGEDEGSTVAPPVLKYPLSVTCLSATLPAGFCGDTGLKARTRHYPSPFDDAYGRSALFVPRATDPADVEALSAKRGHGKPQLDVKMHPRWAMTYIAKLIAANRGRALILSATSDAGKFYAAELRKISGGRWNVYSQWDGRSTTQLLAAWKADTHSVMVGTKSLMTGVDAPGQTCSLVILDRVPRAPSNPVDDARVKLLTERLNSKWQADSHVYAGDAALLLEQAAGRLVRSVSDFGMVAVLDPRLLKPAGSVFNYATSSRNLLMAALKRFDRKMSLIDDAVAFLSEPQVAAG